MLGNWHKKQSPILTGLKFGFGGGGGGVPPGPITASGGLTYEPGNGYKYHVFYNTTPGTPIPADNQPFSADDFVITNGFDDVEILIVAGGGGGGGGYYAGGGGAGGVVTGTEALLPGSYSIEVGYGGSFKTGNASGIAYTGGNSSFNNVIALGGGGGSAGPGGGNPPGGAGGSGGGSSYYVLPGIGNSIPHTVPPAYVGYGHSSGPSRQPSGVVGAGGGGAGGSTPNLNGGPGLVMPGFEYPLVGLSTLNPAAVSNSPTNNHYGGGGGSTNGSPTKGFGGGGAGGGATGENGVDRLGGGGGGSSAPNGTSGRGGHGVVIVRYLA